MIVEAILIKIKERVNKLDSDDFENLPCWKIIEAFNKSQLEWCRSNLRGINILREGDEQSTSKIDDLEKLLVPVTDLGFTDKGIYYQSDVSKWPSNYLRFKRFALTVKKDCCSTPKRMKVDLAEEANVDVFLSDVARRPSYAWGQTFATLTGNMINLYHNKEFSIDSASMIYYRNPVRIKKSGCQDIYDGTTPTVSVGCEFSDDLAEILCSKAAALLDGDIENYNGMNRLQKDVDNNN